MLFESFVKTIKNKIHTTQVYHVVKLCNYTFFLTTIKSCDFPYDLVMLFSSMFLHSTSSVMQTFYINQESWWLWWLIRHPTIKSQFDPGWDSDISHTANICRRMTSSRRNVKQWWCVTAMEKLAENIIQ